MEYTDFETIICIFIINLLQVEGLTIKQLCMRYKGLVFLCAGEGKLERQFRDAFVSLDPTLKFDPCFIDYLYKDKEYIEKVKEYFPEATKFSSELPDRFYLQALYIAINPSLGSSDDIESDEKKMDRLGKIHIFRSFNNRWHYTYSRYSEQGK